MCTFTCREDKREQVVLCEPGCTDQEDWTPSISFIFDLLHGSSIEDLKVCPFCNTDIEIVWEEYEF